jgi:hypothetical protein
MREIASLHCVSIIACQYFLHFLFSFIYLGGGFRTSLDFLISRGEINDAIITRDTR